MECWDETLTFDLCCAGPSTDEGVGLAAAEPSESTEPAAPRRAYVTLAISEESATGYVFGALAMSAALRRVDSQYPLLVLIARGDTKAREKLERGNLTVVEVDPLWRP